MKKSSFMKRILSLAFAVVICLGSATVALAAGSPITGTESDPAQAAINKMLEMPEGTTTPAAQFKFDVVKKSLDESTEVADLADMPAIGTITIDFSSGTTELPVASGVKTVYKESANMFAGVTWPHAGVYTYTVTEQTNTYSPATGETMSYSSGTYDISVYVENGASGPYIAAIGTLVVTPGDPGQTGGDKVDPRPGGDPLVTGDYSKMIFTNTYTKQKNGTGPSDGLLSISKAVAGTMANKEKYFEFNLTLNKPALVTGNPVHKVFVINSTTNAVETTAENIVSGGTLKTDSTHGDYIEITAGTPVSFKLKDNQTLSFMDIYVGTTYTAIEAADSDYKPSVTITVNGGTPTTISPGTVNTQLSTETRTVGDSGTNSAAFINTRETVTPTGISMDNLPFILILVLAAGTFVAFIVVKARKKAGSR